MDKKEEIKRLKKEKNYEEIYRKFGSKEYVKNTPSSYRKKDLNKLVKEGKFEDIYSKYGKKVYNNLLSRAKYQEIKENKGRKSAILWRIKRSLKLTGLYLGIASSTFTLSFPVLNASTTKENEIKYEKEIKNYDNKIKKYAEEVNELKLNDVQVFMKVIDDMWNQIKGYKNPELDLTGFLELDLASEDGYGVCRNMASDVARKLNEINPDYNARTLVVNMGHDGQYKLADVKRKILEENETVDTDSSSKDVQNKMSDILGNHVITLVDVKSDNLIVVLDPTNPGIGIYQNGKIEMLNSVKGNELNFDTRKFTTFITSNGYKDGAESVIDFADSYQESKLSPKQIEEKYGLDAQNQALKEVRKIEEAKANKNLSDKESFKESLKVANLDKTEVNQKANVEEKDIER
jgi:hypothetical protein